MSLPLPTDSQAQQVFNIFHSVPRYYGADIAKAPNTLSWPFSISDPYIGAVLLQAGGVWSLAALYLVIFFIAFVSACCCRRRLAKDADTACARGVACCSGRTCHVLSSTFFVVTLAASMAYTGSFFSGVVKIFDGISAVKSVVSLAAVEVQSGLEPSLQTLTSTATQVEGLSQGQPYSTQAQALLKATQDALASAIDLGKTLNSTAQLFAASDLTIDVPSSNIPSLPANIDLNSGRYGLSYGAWSLVGVTLFWVLLNMSVLSATKFSALLFKTCSCVNLSASVLVTILAGIVYVPALVGSDICVDPAAAVKTIFSNSTLVAPLARDSLIYYSQCSAGGVAPAGAVLAASDALAQINTASSQISAFGAIVSGDPQLDPLVVSMAASINLANVSTIALADSVACGTLSSVWALLISGLCTNTVFSIDTMTLCLGAGAVVAFFWLSTTAHLLRNHPGDLALDLEANEKSQLLSSPITKALDSVSAADASITVSRYLAPDVPIGKGAQLDRRDAAVYNIKDYR